MWSEYLLAWEDLAWTNSAFDYNDFVVLVESVHPVPEPPALETFDLGALLLGGSGRCAAGMSPSPDADVRHFIRLPSVGDREQCKKEK